MVHVLSVTHTQIRMLHSSGNGTCRVVHTMTREKALAYDPVRGRGEMLPWMPWLGYSLARHLKNKTKQKTNTCAVEVIGGVSQNPEFSV